MLGLPELFSVDTVLEAFVILTGVNGMRCILSLMLLLLPNLVLAEVEITLFDRYGHSTAYIATDDGMTIYLWNGNPVAYLEQDPAGGFHIFGFNGRHLGWLVDGIVRDQRGDAVCAQREAMGTDNPGFYTELNDPEPFKELREMKPIQELKEFAPFRPHFSYSWSDSSCNLYLYQGASEPSGMMREMERMNVPDEMNEMHIPDMD